MTLITEEQYAAASSIGICRKTAYSRVHTLGWSVEKALTKTTRKPSPLTEEDYQIAHTNGINTNTAYNRVQYYGWSIEDAITTPTHKKTRGKPIAKTKPKKEKKLKEYAVYKGEELLIIGTIKECAEELNVNEKTIRFYSYPSHLDRVAKRKQPSKAIVSVLLDDDEDDE